jgi:hypothetical protein
MRFILSSLFAFSSLFAWSKGLHVRYVPVVPAGTSTEHQALIPEAWDLYVSEEGFRLEETGGISRIWVGAAGSDSYHLLLNMLGQAMALWEPCAEQAKWRKGDATAPPLPDFTPSAPRIAGEAVSGYVLNGASAWLVESRLNGPCWWGFPKLPLAFLLPESGEVSTWMVAETVEATEMTVDFTVPMGHQETTREDLGTWLPSLKLVD